MKLLRTFVLVTGACAFGASVASAQSTPTFLQRDPAAPVAVDTVLVNDAHWGEHHLRRASVEFAKGDFDRVVRELSRIDFTSPIFPDADRAAYLLAHTALDRGDASTVTRLAAELSGWSLRTPYTEWVGLLARSATTDSLAVAVSEASRPLVAGLVASLLAADGRAEEARALVAERDDPLSLYLTARAKEAAGEEADATWRALASIEGESVLDVEIRGIALLVLADRHPTDATAWLTAVPESSRRFAEAQHRLARRELAAGDSTGLARLRHLFDAHPTYGGRHEVGLELASMALDAGDWPTAYDLYRRLDEENGATGEMLAALSDDDVAGVWRSWSESVWTEEGMLLDAAALRGLAAGSAEIAARGTGETPHMPDASLLLRAAPEAPPLPMPALADWLRVAESATSVTEARHAVTEALADAAEERDRWTKRLRYLDIGYEKTRAEMTKLLGHKAVLDSINASLDANLRALEELRDEATRRLTARADAMRDRAAAHRLWIDAMRHFFVAGPNATRRLPPPPGMSPAAEVLDAEEAFLDEIASLSEIVAAQAPELVARSFEESWRPSIIDRARALDRAAEANLLALSRLTEAIEGELVANSTSPALEALLARVKQLETALSVERLRHRDLRRAIVRQQAELAGETLNTRRESVVYGLGAAAYAIAVSSPDSSNTALSREEARNVAIASLETFLAEYENLDVRGDVRFRLADLRLSRAREEFQVKMARFLEQQGMTDAEQTTAFLPFVDYDPSLELYLAILDEDPEFQHRDAALFNAAMILSDQGDPRSRELFTELIDDHPESRFRQQAHLRVGDMFFSEKQFVRSAPYFEEASRGDDPGFTAIALYKLGWSHFSVDDFSDAADAFRRLMDHYAADHEIDVEADLSDEAENYFIHSLARAGGARSFTDYMDRIGPRPYEQRVLQAMGQLFRRFSLDDAAIEADQLWVSRYPEEAGALVSAQRIVDTFEKSGRKGHARDARLGYASRFVPGSPWHRANDDSTRAEGEAFARAAWKHVALHHHQAARSDSGNADDWQIARDLYENVLTVWPDDAEADRLHYFSAEAATQQADYVAAMDHYRSAAQSDSLPLAQDATWQEAAVADLWYERTRTTEVGSDSLAMVVIDRASRYVERFRDDTRSADLMWRSAQLAFAHEWNVDAAGFFASLADRYPTDERVPLGLALRGDAYYRMDRYEEAGRAYEAALPVAARAGADSLVARIEPAIPVCHYKHAEGVAENPKTTPSVEAITWERFASRFPDYEHAHHAQYRAGVRFVEADSLQRGIGAFQRVIDRFPNSEYVRDSHMNIANAHLAAGNAEAAAARLGNFSEVYPDDPSAADALMQAADLYGDSGVTAESERLQLRYVDRFPEDVSTGMDILSTFARRELDGAANEGRVSHLLEAPTDGVGHASNLARYLALAETQPELVDRTILARTRFIEAEEASADYNRLSLSLPLKASIDRKKTSLETTIERYRAAAEVGVSEWSHASAFRIGQALVGFGDALEQSERPADLSGEDLLAYEEVLFDQAWEFYDRGETVWSDLLAQKGRDEEDTGEWLDATRKSLWPRLAGRFLFHPETDFPLVEATPPRLEMIQTAEAAEQEAGDDVAGRTDENAPVVTN